MSVVVLMAGPRLARRMPGLSASQRWVWLAVGVAVLAACVAVWRWNAGSSDALPALQAAEPILTVRGNPNAPGERAKVRFQLQNSSSRSVTISDVSSTCSCLVPTPVAGRIVQAGEELPLDVEVGVPELGKATQQLLVFHDGPGNPLVLRVQAQGRRELPVLDRVENAYPHFGDLSDAQSTQKVIVNTIEEAGSAPWITGLTADHAAVRLVREDIGEEADEVGGFTRRSYTYTVGWNEIPAQRELRSVLRAKTAIDPEPGVFIGAVAAITEQPPFSPSTVYLQPGALEQDSVMFESDSDGEWQISDESKLPEWLAATWGDNDGAQFLRLALTPEFAGSQSERMVIRLKNDRREAATLTVVASPSR